jgi:hypothetical protein
MTAKKATSGKAKHHSTPATRKAARVYARHHPSTRASRIRSRKAKRIAARRGAPAPVAVEPGYWMAGDNDTMPSCVPVALANAVLAQTGRRASVSDLEALSVALGDAEGMFIPDALNALTSQKESE